MRTSRTWRTTRIALLALFALFFVIPLYAMLDFSTGTIDGGRSGEAWAALVTNPDLSSAILTSLTLARG